MRCFKLESIINNDITISFIYVPWYKYAYFFSETGILEKAKIFPKYLNVCFYDEGIRILVALICWRFSRFYSLLVGSRGFNCTPLLLIDLHICFSAILSLPCVECQHIFIGYTNFHFCEIIIWAFCSCPVVLKIDIWLFLISRMLIPQYKLLLLKI